MDNKKYTVEIDQDACMRCGTCVSLTDEKIFRFDDNGDVEVVESELTSENRAKVQEAADSCPTRAIIVKDE